MTAAARKKWITWGTIATAIILALVLGALNIFKTAACSEFTRYVVTVADSSDAHKRVDRRLDRTMQVLEKISGDLDSIRVDNRYLKLANEVTMTSDQKVLVRNLYNSVR